VSEPSPRAPHDPSTRVAPNPARRWGSTRWLAGGGRNFPSLHSERNLIPVTSFHPRRFSLSVSATHPGLWFFRIFSVRYAGSGAEGASFWDENFRGKKTRKSSDSG